MVIRYFMSSISANLALKKQQQKIEMVLSGKGIEFEAIDIGIFKLFHLG